MGVTYFPQEALETERWVISVPQPRLHLSVSKIFAKPTQLLLMGLVFISVIFCNEFGWMDFPRNRITQHHMIVAFGCSPYPLSKCSREFAFPLSWPAFGYLVKICEAFEWKCTLLSICSHEGLKCSSYAGIRTAFSSARISYG